MTYKTLLVHLDLNGDNEGLLKITGDLAERFDAKVIGIAAAQPIVPLADEGVACADIATQHRQEVDKEIVACEAQFRQALESHRQENRMALDCDLRLAGELYRHGSPVCRSGHHRQGHRRVVHGQ